MSLDIDIGRGDARPSHLRSQRAGGTTSRSRARLLLVLVAAAFVVSACSPLDPVPGEAPLRYRDEIFSNVTKTSNIVYGVAPNRAGDPVTLLLDVYRPTGDTVNSRPLIVWVHGGSFRFGNKGSAEIVDEATTFAKKGYVTASINYRLSTQGCPPINGECIQAIRDASADAQTAVRFLTNNASDYGIDATRVGIGGTSAGAITALHVGYRLAPPSGTAPTVDGAVSLSGGSVLTTPDSGDAPALLFHGTNDNLVPYSWAEDTVEDAHAANLEAYLVTWEGEGHVPYAEHRQQILDLTTNFLYRKLDAGNAAR